MPNKNVAFVEGEALAEDIIFDIADKIVEASWTEIDGVTPVTNRWTKEYEAKDDIWVTYKENKRASVAGIYKHTDGLTYQVYYMGDYTGSRKMDAEGFIKEVQYNGGYTGRKLQVKSITYTNLEGTEVTTDVPGLFLVKVPDPDDVLGTSFIVLIVRQARKELDGSIAADTGWNEWQFVAKMPASAGDYAYAMTGTFYTDLQYGTYGDDRDHITLVSFRFSERYYTADPVNFYDRSVVLKCTPDVPESTAPSSYYVMFRMPSGQYNYFDVYYGTGFVGVNSVGDSVSSYEKACDVSTVKPGRTPTIINQKEAEAAYKRATTVPALPNAYVPPKESWDLDIDGVTFVKSPPSHFFFGSTSVVSWVTVKERRPDYWVGYWLSINNDRLSLVIEGDPAPDMDGYYRSFGYIGKTVPFAKYDHQGNFGITTGMGHLEAARTTFVKKDIVPDTNPIYAGYGRYTSNGITSVSMLRTRSNVLFQSYYPAFITQLPNYKGVGTIPPELSTLILEKDGFQASQWTDKYHASPIYLVHQYEGYRCYMDGVIAINDHNLINMDELVVNTEEWKDPEDHSKGTWTEVYKFFSIKSPVNFFKHSANPDECSIAILKEIK